MDNTKILLLDRFMRGETSPEEEQQLLAWFREVDSQEDILTFYRQRWHESATKEISEEVQLRMFNQIRDRINTDKTVLQKNWKLKKSIPVYSVSKTKIYLKA